MLMAEDLIDDYCNGNLSKVKEALEQARRLVEIEGHVTNAAHVMLGIAYLGVGDHVAALEVFETLPHGRLQPDKLPDIAFAYQQNGRDADAMEIMVLAWSGHEQDIRAGFDAGGWEGLNLALAEALPVDVCSAVLYAMANERDQMYECLEINLIEADPSLPAQVNASGAFSAYRTEPRFKALLSEVNARVAQVETTN